MVSESATGSRGSFYSQIVAGSVAAVFQTTISQPFEFLKTAMQLKRAPGSALELLYPVKRYFTGCSILNVLAFVKTGVRFGTFTYMCRLLGASDASKGTSLQGPRLLWASIATGTMESLCIVPFENVKTTMIENVTSNRFPTANGSATAATIVSEPARRTFHKVKPRHEVEVPRFTPVEGMLSTIKQMHSIRGWRCYLQGLMPTLFRQVGNSAVRFSSYTLLKQSIGNKYPSHSEYLGVILGICSSVCVVALTQPLDVVKTRMQSQFAWEDYRNSLNCAYRIFVEEGVSSFWKGSVPRLFKVGLASGVSFGIYEYVQNLIEAIDHSSLH